MSGGRRFRIADLFCGAGGSSMGAYRAFGYGPEIAINHWPYAIEQHGINHPECQHYNASVFDIAPERFFREDPRTGQTRGMDVLMMSPECKHHSIAKGSAPLDAGRRAQAEVAYAWAECAHPPKLIIVENVKEFESWGPVSEDGKRDLSQAGAYFRPWVERLRAAGYTVDWRTLLASDYGAPQARLRLYVVASRAGAPCWPVPTHGPGRPNAYRTAADILDWDIEVPSILGRKKPLCDATQRRIAQGIQRFVLERPPYLRRLSTDERPPKTDLVAAFMVRHFTGAQGTSLHAPLATVTSHDHNALVVARLSDAAQLHASGDTLAACWLNRAYGNGQPDAITEPLGTVTAGDGHSALCYAFLTKYYTGAANGGRPGTVQGQSLLEPLDTVPTKHRFGLVTLHVGDTVRAITDIGMRFLTPTELARAQDMSEFIFTGSVTDRNEAIGNAVVPCVMEALLRANAHHL